MKAINFLFGLLMLCIATISPAQVSYVGGESVTPMTKGDSLVRALKASGKLDSIANLPATDPMVMAVLGVQNDSSTNPAPVQTADSHQAVSTGTIHDVHEKMSADERIGTGIGDRGMILLVICLFIALIFGNPITKAIVGWIKGAFTKSMPVINPGLVYEENLKNGGAGLGAMITDINGGSSINLNMNQKLGKNVKTKNFNGVLTGATKIKADMTKGTVEAEAPEKLINNVDELLKVEDRVIYRITGKTLPWSFGQRAAFAGLMVFAIIFLTGTIMSFDQPHNTTINNYGKSEIIPTVVVPAATIDIKDDYVEAVTYVNKPVPSVSTRIESVEFIIPGRDADGLMTIETNNNWRLPYNDKGWWIKLEVNGNVVWYPEYSKMNDFAEHPIDLSIDKKADIGSHNPADMAFAFMSTDGEPHKVRLSYWSKSGSI